MENKTGKISVLMDLTFQLVGHRQQTTKEEFQRVVRAVEKIKQNK